MKSGYGRAVPPEDAALTHVGPGTPMGEMMRRYWQPLLLAADLDDGLPKKVRILGEDLVAFRDGAGRIGVLDAHCAHRGTSLEYGRVEQGGIRCCYHGWLYRADGKCVEMPCEQPGYAERLEVWQPAYPVQDYGGIVFVYMGPPEKQPLFPMYDIIDVRGRDDVVLRATRLWGEHAIAYVSECNWLQHFENVVDPYHVAMLHRAISGDQFASAVTHEGMPDIGFEKTPLGVRYRMFRNLPNGNRLERYVECVLPNIALIASIHEQGQTPKTKDRCTDVTWVVPIDDTHCRALTLIAWPAKGGVPDPGWIPGTFTGIEARPGRMRARPYDERQRQPDDMEAQESQRPIAVHALENLALSDRGVALLRRAYRESLGAIAAGGDPQNIVRDPAANRAIETHSWNSVVPPGRVGQAAE
ncbi:MAG: Rieske 2Fe-2S domain-containing protein [Rhodospirillaceae bacterium]